MQTKPPKPRKGTGRTKALANSLDKSKFLRLSPLDSLRLRNLNDGFANAYFQSLNQTRGETLTDKSGFQIVLRRREVAEHVQGEEGVISVLNFGLQEKPEDVAKLLQELLTLLAVGGRQPIQGVCDCKAHGSHSKKETLSREDK